MSTTERIAKRIARLKEETERAAARPIQANEQVVANSLEAQQLVADYSMLVGQNIGSEIFDTGAGVGWNISADGTAVFQQVVTRGLSDVSEGNSIIVNDTFTTDVTGWDKLTGTLTWENDAGTPVGKLVTPASASETYVKTATPVTIDPARPITLKTNVKPAAAGDKTRLGLAWKDSTGADISETLGPYLTGVTAYTDLQLYGEPPTAIGGSNIYVPSSDTAFFNFNGTPINTAGNRYQNIDETTLDLSDYIRVGFANAEAVWQGTTTIASGGLTGKAPVALDITYVHGTANVAYLDPVLHIGGIDYRRGYSIVTGPLVTSTVTWTTNPATGLPWTAAGLEDFRAGGGSVIGLYAICDTPNAQWVYQVNTRVRWTQGASPVKVEPRLRTLPASAAGTTVRWSQASPRSQATVKGGAVAPNRVAIPRVGVHLRRVANQSIGGFTTASISWDTEDEDPYAFITVTSTTITIPIGRGGLYNATFEVAPQSGSASGCGIGWSVNGGTVVLSAANNGTGNKSVAAFSNRTLAAGDTIVFQFYNNEAGAINYTAELWLYRVGE